jgi:hypothetical protein
MKSVNKPSLAGMDKCDALSGRKMEPERKRKQSE